MNISRTLLRMVIVITAFTFASCTQEDPIDELIKSVEINAPSDASSDSNPTTPPKEGDKNPETDPIG